LAHLLPFAAAHGLDALVEVHTAAELASALDAGAANGSRCANSSG